MLIAGATLIAALAVGVFQIEYDANLLHLQAKGLDSVHWEEELIRVGLGAPDIPSSALFADCYDWYVRPRLAGLGEARYAISCNTTRPQCAGYRRRRMRGRSELSHECGC